MRYLLLVCVLFFSISCTEKKQGPFHYFRNYQRTFNDMNWKQLKAAKRLGVKPVKNEEDLNDALDRMEKIKSCSDYKVDKLTYSLPYLVSEAEDLLETIGSNFRDSLDSKGLEDRRIIVTSVFRTPATVKKLRRRNVNASENSTHMYGTTFDIAYSRYDGAEKAETDKLKTVLAEVLRDLRNQKRCYVRYEVKQGCFHITVR